MASTTITIVIKNDVKCEKIRKYPKNEREKERKKQHTEKHRWQHMFDGKFHLRTDYRINIRKKEDRTGIWKKTGTYCAVQRSCIEL